MLTGARRKSGHRLLGLGYAQILRMVVDGPVSWLEVTAKLGLARTTSQRVLRGFVHQGLAHTSHWLWPAKHGGSPRPYYTFGPGVCAVRPRHVEGRQARTAAELLAFCDLVKALQYAAWTKGPLAHHLGQAERTVGQIVNAMHELRLLHIDDYRTRRTGAGAPMFTWGPDEEDAKKPKPMTAKQLHKRATKRRTARRRHLRMIQATASQLASPVLGAHRPPPLFSSSLQPSLGDAGASSATPFSLCPQPERIP
jgi:hypothetical protein